LCISNAIRLDNSKLQLGAKFHGTLELLGISIPQLRGSYAMATYAEIQAQIAHLQQQADAIRQHDVTAAISDIKGKIAQYGLTARDLGLTAAKSRGVVQSASSAKFIGPQGQTWSGRGRQPNWLHAALAAGKTKQDFAA
jgi:DNA-binding protein H-NS